MGGGLEFQDFFPFELKIAIDQIVAEDVAAFQEIAVIVERIAGAAQTARDRRRQCQSKMT